MRAFQILSAALVATAARGQILSSYPSYGGYGKHLYGLGIGGVSYGASYTLPVSGGISYATPAAVSRSSRTLVSSAPVASVAAPVAAPVVSVAAPTISPAAAISVGAAAPTVSYISGSQGLGGRVAYSGLGGGVTYGANGSGGATVTGSGEGIRSHEIHTGGSGNTIRVEEYKAGGQVIRVHDGPRRGTQVIDVQGPIAPENHIRLVSRTGATQIDRATYQDPHVQVFDVANPPLPGDRVINIRKAPAPPAQVELIAEQQQAAPEIIVGGDEPNIQIQHVGGESIGGRIVAAPAVSVGAPAPVSSIIGFHSTPAVSIAAPAVAAAVPTSTYATGISAAPVVSYSTGYDSIYGTGIGYGYSAPSFSYGTSYMSGYSTGSGLNGSSFGSTAILHTTKSSA
ncbi:uncharacterized protein LOC111259185 [Varroa jacobsoni]|uniref:Uncharacterized protein n=1 Tax=Varroa destructor TaxID=109461 RepID=A0A7M7M5I4_VARDE|nr:uncharacterized protein LOC111245963 [Varroa destructor]XP_022686721.1 uncharacterized protein LOC111259185 [Varroa jacobsoni]